MRQEIEELQNLLNNGKYYPARKQILSYLEITPTDLNLWELLANTFFQQRYYREAYEILACLHLVQPLKNFARLEELQKLLSSAPKQRFNFIEFLSLPETTITACLIFKNNVDVIKQWYESISNFVDEIIAVDTGCTDNTTAFLETKDNVTLVRYEWDQHFANARNAALPYVTSEWTVWMDSDEFLEPYVLPINPLKFVASYYKALDTTPLLSIQLHDYVENKLQNTYQVTRMYPNTGSYHFIGRIHEQLVEKGNSQYDSVSLLSTSISFKHIGYTQEMLEKHQKMERNIKMLQLQIVEDPINPAWSMYLGREYLNINDYQNAISHLLLAEQKLKDYPQFNRVLDIYNYLIGGYFKNNQLDLAKEICQKALAIDPAFPNALYYLNHIQIQEVATLIEEAYKTNIKIKQSFDTYKGIVSPDLSILNWRADYLKATILRFNGQLAEAQQTLETISVLEEDYKEDKQFIMDQHNKLISLLKR